MMKQPVVILANGKYPTHPIPVQKLNTAGCIICCDGAASHLKEQEPDAIIGDLDSLDESSKKKYRGKIIYLPDQSKNDLQKAIRWAEQKGIEKATILGAVGKRDDHSLSNIFILLQFSTSLQCTLITDHGIFSTAEGMTEFQSFIGQQISLFAANPEIEITSTRLKYNLNKIALNSLYCGSLNESSGDTFTLSISHGKILVYQVFE